MEALPPILAYIHASEEAEKRAQDAAQPSQPVPVIDPKLSPQGGPSEPLPAGNGQAAGELDGTAADRGPITAEEISSIESRLKRLHFQKEKTPKKVSNRSVVRAVQAMHEPSEGVRRPPICYCGTPRSSEVDVHLREDEAGRKTAGVTGVWRCRNLETCPMCVKVGTARRRDSYARVGGAAVEKGGRIVTVVLSVSHGLQDSLADLMQGVKTASTTARAGNPWLKDKASLGCVGVLQQWICGDYSAASLGMVGRLSK